MNKIRHTSTTKQKRRKRVRSKMFGTIQRPRLSVFRSNKHISLQVINDEDAITLAQASNLGKANVTKGTKTEVSIKVAEKLLKKLKTKKIKALVFDRGHYRFHGRVKAVAEALRQGGIKV